MAQRGISQKDVSKLKPERRSFSCRMQLTRGATTHRDLLSTGSLSVCVRALGLQGEIACVRSEILQLIPCTDCTFDKV